MSNGIYQNGTCAGRNYVPEPTFYVLSCLPRPCGDHLEFGTIPKLLLNSLGSTSTFIRDSRYRGSLKKHVSLLTPRVNTKYSCSFQIPLAWALRTTAGRQFISLRA